MDQYIGRLLRAAAERAAAATEVCHGPDVGIVFGLVRLEQFDDGVAQFGGAPGRFHVHQLHRVVEAVQVLGQSEDVDALFLGIAIGLDTLKHGAHANPLHLGDVHGGLLPFDHFAVPPDVARVGRRALHSSHSRFLLVASSWEYYT